MHASYRPYQLQFKKPILTSRGGMSYKDGYYLQIEKEGIIGIGECSYIKGLSIDHLHNYEDQLKSICSNISEIADDFYTERKLPDGLVAAYPSIAFALEVALLDLRNGGRRKIISDSAFYAGDQDIPINGLVWMSSEEDMMKQLEQKLAEGFGCIKIKVGAIDFDAECRLLEAIRSKYSPEKIEIRVDANGAFTEGNVRERLTRLAAYHIHSIEQPVKPQQYLLMHQLSRENIIHIALDEELIGTSERNMRAILLETIKPQYIVLKPSLLGGMAACDEWIRLADKLGISWWATSALEGNIGLNAIAQWAASKSKTIVQGLGTGGLYTNNIQSPLFIEKGHLKYDLKGKWGTL
jgi:O-succinylbenzoate synthase